MRKKQKDLHDVQVLLYCILLLRKHLFQLCVAGEGMLHGTLRLALDEGENVVHELLRDAVMRLIDPFKRDLLDEVRDLVERQQLRFAAVFAAAAVAAEGDHVVRLSGDSLFHGGAPGKLRLIKIGRGGEVRRAALERGELSSMPRTLTPVRSFSVSARRAARPPSWACPKPSVALVVASETRWPSA